MTKTVDILGAKYKIHIGVPKDKDKYLIEMFGYCSFTDRKITVVDFDTVDGWKDASSICKQEQTNTTLRHEIIHAFLAESGLWGNSVSTDAWALNEEMVDWIALQFPKILKVFNIVGCI